MSLESYCLLGPVTQNFTFLCEFLQATSLTADHEPDRTKRAARRPTFDLPLTESGLAADAV